jgi:hypothetical protein
VVEFASVGHQQVPRTVKVTEHTSQELLLVQRMALQRLRRLSLFEFSIVLVREATPRLSLVSTGLCPTMLQV